MPANPGAASRNTGSTCWIDRETDGRIKRYGRRNNGGCGQNEVVDRMTVETGLAENGAIGWTRMKWT